MRKNEINLEDILTDHAAEEDFLEVPIGERVFRTIMLLALVLSVVVIWQVFNLIVLRGAFYDRRSLVNMSDPNVQIAPRGIIFDRFGAPLIQNIAVFNVFLTPRSLPADPAARLAIIQNAAMILGLDENAVFQNLSAKDWSLSDRLLLKADVSHDEIVALSAANLPGVDVESGFKRQPIVPSDFAHVLGYTGLVNETDLRNNPNLTVADQIGRAGLESYYDFYLRGTDGEKLILSNAAGETQTERTLNLPEAGDNLTTYIDSGLQEYFYNDLQTNINYLGRNVGLGIAMNPQNGQVLALFNIPSYDPNNISAALKSPWNPLFDRAVAGLYSPGSTIKPLDAVAALTEGILNPAHQIFSPGYLDVPNPYDPARPTRYMDWQYQGWVDLYSALAKSSDVYFYEVVGGFGDQQGLGITRLKAWWQKFLLDKPTGIDLPGEASGFLPDPAWMKETKNQNWLLGNTFNVAIGQGDLTVTPLELLNYICAIANGGTLYEPRVMENITDAQGNPIVSSQPKVLSDLSSEIGPHLKDVQQGMRDGVAKPYGTAYMLHDLPIQVAAKTGSAQVKNNTETNALFVGYAPYQNPQIALLILVENAKEGSLNVVPVAKDVFAWYYQNRMVQGGAGRTNAATSTISNTNG
jgi:penicillin-binding protein 2